MNINTKQISFNLAMKKYHEKKRYAHIYSLVSFLNGMSDCILDKIAKAYVGEDTKNRA